MSNFTFQVEMMSIGASGDGGGVIFRHTANSEYRFRVSPDGSYDLVTPAHTLVSGTSTAIKTGMYKRNLLTIIAYGASIYIYVNRQRIAHVIDTSSSFGLFKLFTVDFTHPSMTIFTNVEIFW